jgi:hypothetical protein
MGITTGALESLGPTEVQASYGDVAVSRAASGFDIVSCRLKFSWSLASQRFPAARNRS